MSWLYILSSLRFKKSYVGITSDLKKRLRQHNSGKSSYTSKFKPWVVIYSEEYSSSAEARAREKYYKSAIGRKELKKFF